MWNAIRQAVVWFLVAIVRLYQTTISPMTPASCKFHPTCSAYAVTALRRHGPVKGVALASARLARCHPWQEGGIDPVPQVGRWRPDVTRDGRTVIPLQDIRDRPVPTHPSAA